MAQWELTTPKAPIFENRIFRWAIPPDHKLPLLAPVFQTAGIAGTLKKIKNYGPAKCAATGYIAHILNGLSAFCRCGKLASFGFARIRSAPPDLKKLPAASWEIRFRARCSQPFSGSCPRRAKPVRLARPRAGDHRKNGLKVASHSMQYSGAFHDKGARRKQAVVPWSDCHPAMTGNRTHVSASEHRTRRRSGQAAENT